MKAADTVALLLKDALERERSLHAEIRKLQTELRQATVEYTNHAMRVAQLERDNLLLEQTLEKLNNG